MEPLSDFEIIDSIYEAALRCDLWPELLDRIAAVSDTVAGCLFAVLPKVDPSDAVESVQARWVASPWFREKIDNFIKDGQAATNLRADRLLRANHAGFLTDRDICSAEEIATHPHYEYLRTKGGTGNGAATVIQSPSGDTLIFSWDKWFHEEPVEPSMVARLDQLRPHLARSALMAARLGLERTRAAAEALGMIGLPAAVLSARHRILAANDLFQTFMPEVVDERAAGRIRLCNGLADKLLAEALLAIERHHAPGVPQSTLSIPMAARGERPATVAHVVPLRRTARDIFSHASAVLLLTPVGSMAPPAEGVIRGLFDLTAAEASIAQAIVAGGTIEQIADRRFVSPGTVRNQMKTIFSKTGVSRQAELVSLLCSIRLHR